MKITVFKYGEALYPEERILAGRNPGNSIPMPFCFYLIEKDDRIILVDAGCEGEKRYNMYAYEPPVELLKEYGVNSDDVTDIIVTHAHFDHIEGVNYYKNAVIHIQKDEYANGASYIKDDAKVDLFEDELALFDDVIVKRYGGHSIGSSIVYAGEYLLCGDECYFYRNFEEKIRVGNSRLPERSQKFVEEYGSGKYKPLLFHDEGIMPGKVGFEVIYEG